jgi:antitoxin ParD1/3/4
MMNLSLKPELETFIQREIQEGKYATPNEVVEAALSLLARKSAYEVLSREIGEKVDVAAAQLDQGEGLDGETAVASLRAKLRATKGNH